MSKEDEVKVKITGDASGAKEALRSAADSVRTGVGQIKSHMESLSSIAGKVTGVFIALSAAMAGGRMFKAAIDETVELTKESQALAKQFGMTATQASILKVALDDVYVSQDAMSAAGNRITTTMRTNEEAITQLGIKTRDANGHFRSTFEVMQDVNRKLLTFREGMDRNIEGQKIYGRGWAEIAPTLKLTQQVMEDARTKAEELGLVVGQESIDATAKYRAAMNDVGDVMTGLKKTIGDAVMPALTEMANWFASIGPSAIRITKEIIIGLKDVFYDLKLAITEVYYAIKLVVQQAVILFMSLADAANKALRFDFTGAKAALKQGMDMLTDVTKEYMEKSVGAWKDYQKNIAASESLRDFKPTAAAPSSTAGSAASAGGDPKAGRNRSNDRFQELANALDREKIALGEFREHDLAADQVYWETKLATVKGKTEEDKSLRLKIEKEILRLKKQIMQENRALAEEEINERKAVGELEVENKRDALNAKVQLGRVSMRREVEEMRRIEEQKYQIERAALMDRLKLVEADKLKRAKIESELQILEKQHSNNRLKIERDSTVATQRYWEGIMAPIARTMAQSVQGMLTGTMKLRTALSNIGGSILQEFIELQTQRLTKFLAAETAQTTAAVTGAEIRAVAEETSAKRGLIATIAAALKTIAINAVKVISAVWSSISSIPVIGPFLAPVMALAAGAAVYGLASRISSARGGYDIPKGVNPMTQLHEEEMVLPAKHANAIRRLADGDGGGGRGVNLAVHFNVSAIDRRGVASFFSEHSDKIANALASQMGRFNPAVT